MPTDQATSNKATLTRFQAALSSGDAELISKTIDEVVEPDALIRTPLPIEATGAELLKEVFARLQRGFPDLHITIEDLIAEGTRSSPGKRLPVPIRASTWACHQPANRSRTTRSSSSASRTAESPRPGASSTSSRRCDSSARFREAPHEDAVELSGGVAVPEPVDRAPHCRPMRGRLERPEGRLEFRGVRHEGPFELVEGLVHLS
jgi:SnoaL-like polyketide cyclase